MTPSFQEKTMRIDSSPASLNETLRTIISRRSIRRS